MKFYIYILSNVLGSFLFEMMMIIIIIIQKKVGKLYAFPDREQTIKDLQYSWGIKAEVCNLYFC